MSLILFSWLYCPHCFFSLGQVCQIIPLSSLCFCLLLSVSTGLPVYSVSDSLSRLLLFVSTGLSDYSVIPFFRFSFYLPYLFCRTCLPDYSAFDLLSCLYVLFFGFCLVFCLSDWLFSLIFA